VTAIEDSRLEGQELPSSRRSEDLFGVWGGEGRGDFGKVGFGDGEFLAGGALSLAEEAKIAMRGAAEASTNDGRVVPAVQQGKVKLS
jgi:hypothetical protein